MFDRQKLRYKLSLWLHKVAFRLYPLQDTQTTGCSGTLGDRWYYWRLDGSEVTENDPQLRHPDVRWTRTV